MSANARVFRSGVFAKTFTPKDIILDSSDIGNVHAGLEKLLSGLLRLVEDRERALLLRTGFTQHQGSANLRIVSVDLRAELSYDVVALLKPAFRGRLHSEHFGFRRRQ